MTTRNLTALAGSALLLATMLAGAAQDQARPSTPEEIRAQQREQKQEDRKEKNRDDDRREAQGQRQRAEDRRNRAALTEQQRQERIREQRRSVDEYRRAVAQQQARHAQTVAASNSQRRAMQRQQWQYRERMRIQQLNFRNQAHDYDNNPYYGMAAAYGYRRDGRQYETNRYGAATLRAALNNGYREGFRAGVADRQDRWQFSYRDSTGYRDANYGYGGRYVPQADYAHYFREGFQRGYDDGYHDRRQYGRRENGTEMLLGNLITSILNLQPLR
jgi:hypothetical protein